MDDQPTRLWSLQREEREMSCDVKLVPYGIEIIISHDGEPFVTRVFETGEEALAWAEKKRGDRETAGWKKVSA